MRIASSDTCKILHDKPIAAKAPFWIRWNCSNINYEIFGAANVYLNIAAAVTDNITGYIHSLSFRVEITSHQV